MLIDLFMILFGGGFSAYKVFSEKQTRAANDYIIKSNLNWRNEKQKELGAPYQEYEQLEKSLYRQPSRDFAIKEVEDALKRIFGSDYRSGIKEAYKDIYPGASDEFHFDYWLPRLVMAKRGKLDPLACYGYRLGGGKFIKINVGFCREIEHYLHKAGHTEMLLGTIMPADRIDNPLYRPTENQMEWMCPGAWGNKHKLW